MYSKFALIIVDLNFIKFSFDNQDFIHIVVNLCFTIAIIDFKTSSFKILKEDIKGHIIISKTIDNFDLIANFIIKKTKGFKYKE